MLNYMSNIRQFHVYSPISHFAFLFPLFVLFKNYEQFSPLFLWVSFLAIGSSLLYHLSFHKKDMAYSWSEWFRPRNKRIFFLRLLDWFSATLLMILALHLLVQIDFWNTYLIFSLLSFLVGFFFLFYKWRENYDFYHALWHVGVALSFGFLLLASL